MKMIYLLLLMPWLASAQTRIVDGDIFPGVEHRKNYVLNPELEKNKNNITDASAISSRSTVTPLSGAASLLVDGTAAAQKVIFVFF